MNHFLCVLFCLATAQLSAFIDLDQLEQPFVLEAKQLHIEGYPEAFNPSIVQWKNRVLMSFRGRDRLTNLANVVGFIWLDKNLNPIGKPELLELTEGEMSSSYIQDPRLIVIKDKLYMVYSDLCDDFETQTKKRRLCLAELIHENGRFVAIRQDCMRDFQGDKFNKFEKNWVPFDYEGIMLLSYTLSPHKVFLPIMGESKCVTISETSEYSSWNWGVLRGGTTALLVGKYYLSFFHSSVSLTSVQSKKSMPHYFMGAYLFEKYPPFSIKKISPHPIVSKDFYNGKQHKTWKPLQVIFPCGYIFDKKYIWVSYGRQDQEAWIIKLDKAELLNSLVPFESNHYE